MKPVHLIVVVFLLLVASLHLLRLMLQVEVTVAMMVVPMWISWPACLITVGLAWLLWREGRQ